MSYSFLLNPPLKKKNPVQFDLFLVLEREKVFLFVPVNY